MLKGATNIIYILMASPFSYYIKFKLFRFPFPWDKTFASKPGVVYPHTHLDFVT